MNIYVMRAGKRTSVSIDEQLVGYLMARLGKRGNHGMARRWIQLHIDAAGGAAPERRLSQWVQALVLRAIVDPVLKTEGEHAEDAQQNAQAKALQNQRQTAWEEYYERYERGVAHRARLERIAKAAAKDAPRYRAAPKMVKLP